MKEESEKDGLKLNIQKTKIIASDPITSWQIDGETVANFILRGSKITVREGNGNPLRYSYLENPVDGGAWLAAVTVCSDFGASKNDCHCFYCFPIYLP